MRQSEYEYGVQGAFYPPSESKSCPDVESGFNAAKYGEATRLSICDWSEYDPQVAATGATSLASLVGDLDDRYEK